ncbi:MAG: IS91 family transposase [Rhodothermales bacterium]|nr:IS91 family transposase [Rhodothermales bacterium]
MADVIQSDGVRYLKHYRPSKEQYRVLNDLAKCRTAALGGHLKQCDECAREIPVYNSCRNRHCPKCQGAARAAWLEAREGEVLDVEYFHVVFTVPHELAPLALQNRRVVYGMLFRAASETLMTLGRDSKHLGAELGCLVLLHTWGQNLLAHPHLHCVIPGGGLSLDGERWVPCQDGFFLPVRVLSRLFRGKFVAELQRGFDRDQLVFHGRLQDLRHPKAWEGWLETLRNKDWVVYAKPPFGGPRQVLKYLARYTHRVAISNHRLISTDDGKVTFRWKDYANAERQRIVTLDAVEFLRRFLLHVLPKGFMRVRYYGFLANRHRAQKLERIRFLLGQQSLSMRSEPPTVQPGGDLADHELPDTNQLCPHCKKGRLRVVAPLPVKHLPSWSFDSS